MYTSESEADSANHNGDDMIPHMRISASKADKSGGDTFMIALLEMHQKMVRE